MERERVVERTEVVWSGVRGSNWRSVGVLLATLTFACMHFSTFLADFAELCSVAALFDGQKSTRSRVHFKLNLFAGAKWSAKAGKEEWGEQGQARGAESGCQAG